MLEVADVIFYHWQQIDRVWHSNVTPFSLEARSAPDQDAMHIKGE